jgi:hypothetical protein
LALAVGLYLAVFFLLLHLLDRLATRVPPEPPHDLPRAC